MNITVDIIEHNTLGKTLRSSDGRYAILADNRVWVSNRTFGIYYDGTIEDAIRVFKSEINDEDIYEKLAAKIGMNFE